MNTTSNIQSHEREEEVDIKALMYDLWAHKWVILACAVLCLTLAGVYTLRLVPQYQSSVLLQVDSKQPGLSGGMSPSLSALFGGDSGASAATQIALIQSRFVLEPVIHALGLDIKTAFKPTNFFQRILRKKQPYQLRVSLLNVPHELVNQSLDCTLIAPNRVRLMHKNEILAEGPVGKKLSGKVTFKVDTVEAPVGASFIIRKLSTTIVVQQILSRLSIEEADGGMRQNTGVLTATLKGDSPNELVAVLNQIAQTTKEKDTAKKAQEAAQTLAFLNQQLPLTKRDLEKAERQLNHYRAKSGKIDLKLQAQLLLQQLAEISKKEAELRIERIQMAQQYTDIHPIMQAMDAQFKAIAREEQELRQELKSLPESDQLAVNLTRDVKVKQALYKLLLQKIQELQVLKAGTVSSVRILALAKLPDAPLPSKKAIVYLGGLMLGLLLGCTIVFVRKLLWPKIDDPHWLERRFNLPNLATVPYCEEVSVQTNASSQPIVPLVAYSHPKSLAVESLRSLRTSMQVMLACAPNNVISILGLSPGVGKSFVSANLAYLLAAGGKRVLVIDSDLRRGTLHKYFNVSVSPGLADILEGKQTFESVVNACALHENLSVLPRGAYPSDPSELLMGPHLKALVDRMSKAYDVVVFDSAPILLVTDAMVVAEHSALNYLVVAAGTHQPNELELALKRLSNAGVRVQGTVFNFHTRVAKTSYLYYHYGQYYKNSYYYHDDESVKISS
jgi:tyrosine-protein kinase Etk/Wzc